MNLRLVLNALSNAHMTGDLINVYGTKKTKRTSKMVGARKESRLWGCLNVIEDIVQAVECCKAFKLNHEDEVKALSIWERKRRRVMY